MNSARSGYTGNMLLPEKLIDELRQALSEMSFGHITIIVQDGKVIQIEKTEKIRLTKSEQERKA